MATVHHIYHGVKCECPRCQRARGTYQLSDYSAWDKLKQEQEDKWNSLSWNRKLFHRIYNRVRKDAWLNSIMPPLAY